MGFFDTPPNFPNTSQSRDATPEDQERFLKERERRRKQEEEDRKRRIDGDLRGRTQQTKQDK